MVGNGRPDQPPTEPARRLGVVLVVVGVLVAAFVVAVVLTRDGGDGVTEPSAGAVTTSAAATQPAGETGAVEIVGTPLPAAEAIADPAADPAVGMVVPAVLGSDFAGIPVSVDPTDGVAKAIVFIAHWCPHCQAEVPRVQEWLDSGGGVPGVEIISVSTAVDPDSDNYPPSAWLAEEGWTSPVIRDSEATEALTAFGTLNLPYWVFVDAQGTVVRRSAGELDIALLEQYMTEAAGGGAASAAPPTDNAGFRAQPTACGADQPPEPSPMSFDTAGDAGIDPASSPGATIVTSCGAIVVELDPASAPATVNSFAFLAESGYFDGTVAHRVLPGFVVQMGDPTGTGGGGPGYVVPDEPPPAGTVYVAGTLAMANAGPGTTGSQFFITLSDVELPPDYSIFGRVVDGEDALTAIAAVPVAPNARGEPSVPLETVYIESVTIDR